MGASNTKFSKKSTAMESADGIDLNGKVILITGCNTGIGKETARVLALHGAKIYMLCRNMEKANKAREDIIKSIKDGTGKEGNKNFDDTKIVTLELDLSSLLSVRRCVGKYLSLNEPIDYLINNAGIMAVPEWRGSKDGYEMQFATNHLGHFYLTTLLTPLLLKCTPSRVVNLASSAHSQSPKIDNEKDNFITKGISIKDGPLQKDYGMKGWRNYGLSKASNVLFAREYNRRYQKNGIISVSVHPGVIKTELGRHTGSVGAFFLSVGSVFMKSIPQGAATTVRCVSLSDEEIAPGHYYKDCNEANSALRNDIKPYRGRQVEPPKVTKPATKEENEPKADVETDKEKDAPKDDAEKEVTKDEEPKADEATKEEDKPKEDESDKTEDKPEDADKEQDDGDKAKEEQPKEEDAPKEVEETKQNDLEEEETKTESQEIEEIVDVNSAEYKLWEWSELLITEKGFKLDMEGFEEEEKERQLQEEKEEAERLEKERLEKEAAEQKAKEDAEKAAKEEEEKKEDKAKDEEAPKQEDAPKEEDKPKEEAAKTDEDEPINEDKPKEEEAVKVDEETPNKKEEDAPKEEEPKAADDANEAEATKEEEPKADEDAE